MAKGIKFLGDGEWQARKPGVPGRRQWRKVHLAMDTATSDIRAVEFAGPPKRKQEQEHCERDGAVAQNNLRNAIDDYFFDVLRDERGVDLPVEVLDDLELKIMDLARARFAA